MTDFNFYQTYFDELEKFEINAEKGTFNSLSSDKFTEYRKHISDRYNDFEKQLDSIIFNDTIPSDKLIRNFGILNVRFNSIKNATLNLYSAFVNRHKFLYVPSSDEMKVRKIPSGNFLSSTDLKALDAVVGLHVGIISKTEMCIQSRLSIVNKSAAVNTPQTQSQENIKETIQNSKVSLTKTEKISINLNKQQIALFFLMLKEANILYYSDDEENTKLKHFIESNFKYKLQGDDSYEDIKNINSQFSKLVFRYESEMKHPIKVQTNIIERIKFNVNNWIDNVFGKDLKETNLNSKKQK